MWFYRKTCYEPTSGYDTIKPPETEMTPLKKNHKKTTHDIKMELILCSTHYPPDLDSERYV